MKIPLRYMIAAVIEDNMGMIFQMIGIGLFFFGMHMIAAAAPGTGICP